MSNSKTLKIIVLMLLPFLSFAEWGADDKLLLQQIQQDINNLPFYGGQLSNLEESTGEISTDLHAFKNMYDSRSTLANNTLYDIYTKLGHIYATIQELQVSNWTYEDILYVKEKLAILDELRSDISDIGDDVYLIQKDVRGILSDTGFIKSDVSDIRDILSQLPSFLSASEDNQNTIIEYIKYANDNMFGDKSEEQPSLYKIVDSMYNDFHAVTNYFSQYEEYLWSLHDSVDYEEDFSYINVSNINHTASLQLDLSILTNAILGSAFVNPEYGWGDYYSIYEAFQDGAIDPEIFIAEMGMHNWFAGLNFGDWYVNTPDDEDMEDPKRWGIVEHAKMLWAPVAESTLFTPWETSDARYFLYGTRDLTDNSTNLSIYLPYLANLTNQNDYIIADLLQTNNLYFSELNEMMKTNLLYQLYQGRYLNLILANNRNMNDHLKNIELYTKDLPELVKILKNWETDNGDPDDDKNLDAKPDDLEEPPQFLDEELPNVNNILATEIPEDSVNQAVSFINEAKSTFDYEVGEADDFFIPIDLDIFGVEVGFDIEIEDLDQFQAMWEKIAKFVTALFKITTMIIVARCTIKTFMSDMQNVELF